MINSLQSQFPPLVRACSSYPIQNSKFKIHNSKCATPFGKLSEFAKVFSVNLFQYMTFIFSYFLIVPI